MIVTEHPYNGDENLVRTVSDKGVYIRQIETGAKYDVAIDVYPCRFTYTETDELIKKNDAINTESLQAELDDALAALEELGVTDNG